MSEDTTATLPNVDPEQPTPLKVIPRTRNPQAEFIRDTIANTIIILTIAGLIYLVFYAMSAGWHDGMRYE